MKKRYLLLIALLTISCSLMPGLAKQQIPVTGSSLPNQLETEVDLPDAMVPSARMWASLFYHPASSRVVLFGGGRLTDLWSLDAGQGRWLKLEGDGVLVLKRLGGVRAAYDTRAQHMLVFFYIGAGLPGETWAYDLQTNTWQNLQPKNQPVSRRFTDLVYDAAADRTLMFGGVLSDDELAPTNEMWAFDYQANTWTQMPAAENGPAPVFFAHMAYAAALDEVLVWGGKPETAEKTVWSYNLAQDKWTSRAYEQGPRPDYDGAIAYAAGSGQVFLYVGDQFWAYDPQQPQWSQLSTEGGPGKQYGGTLVYDEHTQRLVFFGGTGGTSDTWIYDLASGTWKKL